MDWNTLKGIKNAIVEPFISIRKVLEKHNDHIFIPYSPSHLSDLNKDYENNRDLIDSDLRFLSSISNNLLIAHFWGDKEISFREKNVIDYFHEKRESKSDETSISDIMSSVFNNMPQIKALLDGLNLKSLMPNLSELEKSESGKVMSKQFKTFFETGNIMDLINDVSLQQESFHSDPNEFNDLRNGMKKDLALDSNISNWENAIENLDSYLSKSVLDKSFSQMLDETVKRYQKEPTALDYYLSAYQQLGLFGFRPDNLTHKNTYSNSIEDGNHSLYGIKSNCFITSDKVMYYRTVALKEFFKVDTDVFKTFKIDNLDILINDIEKALI